MRLLKRLLVGLLAFLMLAMLVAYLTPLDVYVPDVERTLSEKLQTPVRVGGLRAGMLPLPHLELRDVLMGGQDGVMLRSVVVSPNLAALLDGRLALHIEAHDGAAYLDQLNRLVEVLGSAAIVDQGMTVRELRFSDLMLMAPEMVVGPLEGKLEFGAAGALQRAWFAMDDRRLSAVLSQLPDRRFSLQVRARDWTTPQLPAFPRLPIDELELDGVCGQEEMAVQRFLIVSRELRMEGAGRLGFSDRLDVRFELAKVETTLERLMILLGRPVTLTGSLAGRGRIDSKANGWGGLVGAMGFAGDLRMNDLRAHVSESFKQPLAIDTVQSRIELHPGHLDIRGLRAALYGGELSGEATLERETSRLSGQFTVSDIDMRPLVEALTNEVLFTGRMDSQARLTMNLDRLDRMPENLKLAARFQLRDGTLSKVDLAQAASNSGKTENQGGVTRFSDLTGALRVDASGYHFRELKMSSGSLDAAGRIDMTPALQLNGELEVDVKGTVGFVGMPLVVSGTLDHPVVRVSGTALAGAAVGTAVLGPGLGTALGVKLGGFMNKLFGNKSGDDRVKPKSDGTR